MHYKKIYKQIDYLNNEYERLKHKLLKQDILESKKWCYLRKDKEEFKLFWEEYIIFLDKLQFLLKKSSYRTFFFIINYNKLAIRKYLVSFYYQVILDLIDIFWKNEDFLRVFLDENFKKDYWYYAKYIYKPRYINILNTPKNFIEAFENRIDKDVYKLIWKLNNFDWEKRLYIDYNNIFYYIKYRVDKLIFLISKKIWHLIAHLKFTSRENWLIKKENIKNYLEIAKPWDIFLSRWNWHASNISIPGFWKHMSMYLWTWKYLKKNFNLDFLEELEEKTHYVIEATWDWVNIVKLYDFSSQIDYLWVFRTTFKKEKIQRSINNSLNNIWKSYDYIFNYYSDKRLVCSSLILKSYAKEKKHDEWISIELEEIWISLTYPPNNLIKKINEDFKDDKKEVEAIFFIDSYEKTWENFISTTWKLLKSWDRPKLSVFLK